MYILLAIFLFILPASAAVPEAVLEEFKSHYKNVNQRADGLIQADGKTWLEFKGNEATNGLELSFKDGDDFLFSDGTIYTPIENNTVKSFDFYHPKIQAKILATNLVQSFLIPKDFSLPRDLAITMGRLPLELRTVELASDRELRFRERLEQEQEARLIDAIAYSHTNGNFMRLQFEDEAKVEELKSLSEGVTYISAMKMINGKIYYSDFHKAELFELNQDELEPRSLFSFSKLGMEMKLLDFQLDTEAGIIYGLDLLSSSLVVANYKDAKILKSIKLPTASSELIKVRRSAAEPDELLLISKAKATITMVGGFDFQISREIDLKKSAGAVLPHSLVAGQVSFFVGVENLDPESGAIGRILVYDSVSHKFLHAIDLDFVPYDLLLSKNKQFIYCLGANDEAAYLAAVGVQEGSFVQVANLAPDIVSAKSMDYAAIDDWLLITSSGTNTVAVFDIPSWQIVHKLDMGETSNLLVSF